MFKVRPTLSGSSLPINLTFLVLNLSALAMIVMSALPFFAASKWLFGLLGAALLVFSVNGLVIFRGRLLMSSVVRVITGSVFIVSGLVKLNDPVGFSYKLAEYFEDGALAYRIKELFSAPGFSLEFLIPYALGIGVAVCVIEIVLGVMMIIGGLPKLTGWLMLLIMTFFTFLTWHTATCNPNRKFTDRNSYDLSNPIQQKYADLQLKLGQKDKSVQLISRTSSQIVLDEQKTPQCVTDCGCFGDALKGSVGRSLTPVESFLKDLVLLYFSVWIFAARRITHPNSVRRNWWTIPVSLLLIGSLCFLFEWYFPLIFGAIALLTALWFYRSGGRFFGNHYGSATFLVALSLVFGWFCMEYDTLKDFRPYAVGSNLKREMMDGIPGKYSSVLVYKNLRTGKLRKFDASGQDFLDSKVWEKPATWKFVRNETTALKEGKRASIDSLAFNPSINANAVSDAEKTLPFVQKALQGRRTTHYTIRFLDGRVDEVGRDDLDYIVNTEFQIIDSSAVTEVQETEISARDFIVNSKTVILIVSRNPAAISDENKLALAALLRDARKSGITVLMLTSAGENSIRRFRTGGLEQLPVFLNDDTELKVITRSNPSILVLKNGVVKGKYPAANLPDYQWIQKHIIH